MIVARAHAPFEALDDDLLDIHGRDKCCRTGSALYVLKELSHYTWDCDYRMESGVRRQLKQNWDGCWLLN
jgi:hypothetical protein